MALATLRRIDHTPFAYDGDDDYAGDTDANNTDDGNSTGSHYIGSTCYKSWHGAGEPRNDAGAGDNASPNRRKTPYNALERKMAPRGSVGAGPDWLRLKIVQK